MSRDLPEGRVVRAGTLAAVLGTEGAKLARAFARSGDARAVALDAQHQASARKLADALGRMKGGAMKVGQLASFLDTDLLPEELRPIYQEELARLRDQAPALPWPDIRAVLESEWEAPVHEVVAAIEERPAAAASIGQVHRATLLDGRDVAVKVQYPGVAAAVRADLGNARLVAHLGRILMPHLDAGAVADELRDRITEELDYEYEAAMQRRFARAFRGHPFIVVPDVVTALSRERVLVSEWVDGEPFEAVRADPDGEARGRFGEAVYRFFFGAIHHLSVLDADPHPGNLLRLEGDRLAVIDFGATKVVEPGDMPETVRLLEAAVRRDAGTVLELLHDFGWVVEPRRVDAEHLLDSMWAQSGWYLEDASVRVDRARVTKALNASLDPRAGFVDLARRLAFPADQLQFQRMEKSVLAVLGQLDVERNWLAIAREWWQGGDPATPLGEAERAFWRK